MQHFQIDIKSKHISNVKLQRAGMNEGDYVVAINDEDVKWAPHDEVVSLIKSSGNHLKLKLVTPMDKSNSKENKVSQNGNS